MIARLLLGGLVYLCVSVGAHELKWGVCPSVDVQKGFDFHQFLGKWYVIQRTRSMSSCITLTFFEMNGTCEVKETSKPLGIAIPYIFESFSQIGALTIPNSKDPAKMKVAFPFSMLPYVPVGYWVLDTDYVNHALMWSCRSFVVGHAQSAMILSRQPVLERDVVNKLRDKLDYFGINKFKLTNIDQVSCAHNYTLDPSELDHTFESPYRTEATTENDVPASPSAWLTLPTADDADNEP